VNQDESKSKLLELDEFRRKIDQCDEEIVHLLNTRASCAREIGNIKQKLSVATYQPTREQVVLEHVRSKNEGPLKGDAITRVFRAIIGESRKLEGVSDDEKV
jgi:chorismate mutase/prephenate dehydratase